MLTASQSEPSALAGRKRKAIPIDAESICRSILDRLRQQLSTIDDDEWETVTAAMLADPNLTKTSVTSKPFTEAHPFFSDLFQDPEDRIKLIEDQKSAIPQCAAAPPDAAANPYEEAAATLRANPIWKSIREHVVMDNETSSRTVIDLIVLTAVELAQRCISEQAEVDERVCGRHHLTGPKWSSDVNGRPVGSRVVLHQEVDIPGQPLLPGVALHGILDYLLGVVPADHVKEAFIPTQNSLSYIGRSLASILVTTIDSPKAWSQVTAQGAALCVLAKRKSVINALTDGNKWIFVNISKTPDQAPPLQTPNNGGRRSSGRLASKQALPTVTETETKKPFTVASTRILDIHGAQRDLAIVLRLLTNSILESPEIFNKLAALGNAAVGNAS
ncbi:hypothetical protein C8J57DRAFT_1219840 [Mycena rebaudengoi]|nr:hypothetical protein C8J57DRAFT_1219840 [Mycena rebaudengoi]